jgi:hypothetical protein
MNNTPNFIWIFHGAKSQFSSGVFTKTTIAEEWIKKHKLTGMLTKYPIDIGTYNWAIENNLFTVKKESQKEPLFIQGFSSASQQHHHYEDGIRQDGSEMEE